MRAAFKALAAGLCGLMMALLLPVVAAAHPMPDSEIIVARGPERVDFTIRVPMDDLLLAMKDDPAAKDMPRDAAALLAGDQAALKAYVARHMVLERDGRRAPLTVDAMTLVSDSDADVGDYAELEVQAHGMVADSEPAALAYDLVLGRIANHRAVVRTPDGTALGVIRYSLAEKKAEALVLLVGQTRLASAPRERPALKSGAAVEEGLAGTGWLWIGVAALVLAGAGLWIWRRG